MLNSDSATDIDSEVCVVLLCVCVWQLAKESLQQLTEWTAICAAKRVDKGRHCGRNSFAALLALIPHRCSCLVLLFVLAASPHLLPKISTISATATVIRFVADQTRIDLLLQSNRRESYRNETIQTHEIESKLPYRCPQKVCCK